MSEESRNDCNDGGPRPKRTLRESQATPLEQANTYHGHAAASRTVSRANLCLPDTVQREQSTDTSDDNSPTVSSNPLLQAAAFMASFRPSSSEEGQSLSHNTASSNQTSGSGNSTTTGNSSTGSESQREEANSSPGSSSIGDRVDEARATTYRKRRADSRNSNDTMSSSTTNTSSSESRGTQTDQATGMEGQFQEPAPPSTSDAGTQIEPPTELEKRINAILEGREVPERVDDRFACPVCNNL
jgi:hypothetical protein